MTSGTQREIDAIIEMADAAQARKDWQQARTLLERGLQDYPDNVALMTRLGKVLRFCGGFAEAVEVLEQAATLAPDDYEVLYQLGIVLRNEAMIWRALTVHTRLVERFPDDASAQHVLANDYTFLGRPEKALPILEQLCAAHPKQTNYQLSYGQTLNKLGRFTAAIQTLSAVLKDKPRSVDTLLFLAEAHQGLLNLDQWAALVKQAYGLSDRSANVQLQMHNVLMYEGATERALGHLQQALKIHPRFFQAHIAMGSYYWETDRADQAQQWFESALEIASWNGKAMGMLAQFQAETGRGKPDLDVLEDEATTMPYSRLPFLLGRLLLATYRDYDRALRLLKLAVESTPEDVSARKLLGDTYIMLGEHAAAAREFSRVLDLAPHWDLAWIGLAYASLQAEDFDVAEQAYARAIELRPRQADLRHGYGVLLLERERTDEAIGQLQQAAELEPDNGEIFFSLAQALHEAERNDEARAAASKAQSLLPEDHEELSALLHELG